MPTERHRREGKARQAANVPTPAPLADGRRIYLDSTRIIDALHQPLLLLDKKLRVVFLNRAFCRTFMVSADEALGRDLAAIGDPHAAALRDALTLMRAENAVIEDYEIEIELPALGRRVLLLNAQRIGDELLKREEILITIDDVTDRKRAELALVAAKWHSERANLSKSRFLSAASQDLRQPLQTLSLMRAILAKKIQDKEALELINRLNKTTAAMFSMLDTLQDLNQLEAEIIQPEKVNFPINDLLEQLWIEFTYHAQVHSLVWHVVPCRMNVYSDPRLLGQMIRNLLSNAVKFTERGKILLGCRRRGDKLRIEVWDTGPGISERQRQAICAEFDRQFEHPAPVHSASLGLGLSIVQRLGNLLGHPVDVKSHLGKGSMFAIEAPLAHERPEALPQSQWGALQNVGRDAEILIVENDQSLREMLALLFTSEGYRTFVAADGKQAFALAHEGLSPDLVVADYGLPSGLTGLQVILGIREVLGRELPAIILTENISSGNMTEITRRGCVQRNKPVRAEELMHLAQSLLTKARQPIVRTDPLSPPESKVDVPPPTIFIVDDEATMRNSMREFLEEDGWSVEVYSSGDEFLAGYHSHREGCLVVDAMMPRMDGFELLEALKARGGGPPAIMITGHANIRLAVRAMKAGAVAFLEKPVQYDELVVSIERALELARNSAVLSTLREAAARQIAGLTPRERQVIEMVVEGNPNKQISYVLGISQRTVETHRATAMKKIGARTLSELIHLTIAASPHDAKSALGPALVEHRPKRDVADLP